MQDRILELPKFFKNKIKREFGKEAGKKWLESLPEILGKCLKKWNLSKWEIGQDLSYNLICFALSPDYGEVVLKIGFPHPDLFTEMTALALYNGRNICKCYDQDKELGAMLLEKIFPGINLTHLEDNEKKVEIASDLITKLYINIDQNYNLPEYKDWLQRAFKTARKKKIAGKKMFSFISRAEKIYNKLETANYSEVLLHGDLHHFNILKDGDQGWKVIDPKGVIGFPFFECARFMENQLNMVVDTSISESLQRMIEIFSEKFEVAPGIIAKTLFVDYVLSTCWSFEDNVDPKKLRKELKGNIEKCQLVLTYIEKLNR
ncbi:MAG: aminoglycoside phosphotransferase family protein [Halanaerobiales bacterium]